MGQRVMRKDEEEIFSESERIQLSINQKMLLLQKVEADREASIFIQRFSSREFLWLSCVIPYCRRHRDDGVIGFEEVLKRTFARQTSAHFLLASRWHPKFRLKSDTANLITNSGKAEGRSFH
jgi:hypothetical protein